MNRSASWISSAESAASASGLSAQECGLSPSVSASRTREPSSPSTGRTSPVTTMCEPSPQGDLLPMESESMSSVAGSPARTSVLQELDLALLASDPDCGASTPDLLASYDPDSSSWRTSQLCLEGGLAKFSETWPRSGLMRSGTAYRLPPLVPLTAGTESGLWPTPMLPNGGRSVAHAEKIGNSYYHKGKKVQFDLNQAVKLWPTPTVSGNHNRKGASATSGDGLATAVRMWPTPQASDNRDRGNLSSGAIQRRIAAGKQLMLSQVASDKSGALNPTWVEWLMGFPLGWTALSASETPSSRKSRNSSAEPSCKRTGAEP